MGIILKDSKDIYDIWKMARKYNCDDFHAMLVHKLNNNQKCLECNGILIHHDNVGMWCNSCKTYPLIK